MTRFFPGFHRQLFGRSPVPRSAKLARQRRAADALCLSQLHTLFAGILQDWLPSFKRAKGTNRRAFIYPPLVNFWDFQKGLEELGLGQEVITFACSDFGRTLRSNGRGTDHAWGGNSLVMSGPVQGGCIYGAFPDLTSDGSADVGYGGHLLPTTKVDQLFGELLRWFGVSPADLPTVLPNITNFYAPSSPTLPIGFLNPGTYV